MTQAYSTDLRIRVIQAAMTGMSARAAAERFGIGVSTAIVWVRRFREGAERAARRQGKPRGSQLDPHEAFIRALVEETKDFSLAEIAARLDSEQGGRVGLTTVWKFLDRCDLTYKERRPTRPSSNART